MRIELGSTSNDVHVFDDKGNDITTDLCITELAIYSTPGDFTKVQLTCFAKSIVAKDIHKVDVIKSSLTVSNPIKHKPEKPQSPEATLKSFKIKKVA